MAGRRANGEGSIRKRSSGVWEGRISTDTKRKSVYGKSRIDVRKKLTEISRDLDEGEYLEESNMTVAQWLTVWQEEYLEAKPSTMQKYEGDIRLHIIPSIGNVKLSALTPIMVQKTYRRCKEHGLSAKSIKNVHGVLHKALDKAVRLGMLKRNVSDNAELPKIKKTEMRPFDEKEIPIFLNLAKDDSFRDLFYVDLFTGLRECELLGLTWDCVDFEKGTIRIYRQFRRENFHKKQGEYKFVSTKNGKDRIIEPARQVMEVLKRIKLEQAKNKLKLGSRWKNEYNMVFVNNLGGHLTPSCVYRHFKRLVDAMGLSEMRFHDLRHTYATLAIQNGTDFKTVSESLGHFSVAFTMDRYGHVSNTMRRSGAEKMAALIENL